MKSRPAESTAAAGTIATVLCWILHVRDPQVYAAIAAGVGIVPAVVTALVEQGGLVGLVRHVLFGIPAKR